MTGRVILPTQFCNTAGTVGVAVALTIVDKCVLHNISALPVAVTTHIIPTGNLPGSTNQLASVTLAAGATYHCPELVGAWLSPGDAIGVIAGTATAVTIYAGGRQ